MRYLVLSADYLDFSIRDVADGEIDRDGIPAELQDQLRDWNSDYQSIVALGDVDRSEAAVAEQIANLDQRGKVLAGALASILLNVGEVRYYSEGKLTYIP
ncbi:hypothetical protein ABZ470_39135 [Streptosporangium sp. NPDC020072]|uniref:hypothetical protein n=1 Tax=Streptosporangium sp. NPDC020072 TaxID=3154788 RepID=UPI0034160550